MDGHKSPPSPASLSLGTLALHADDPIALHADVAPSISVSSTFKRPLMAANGGHVYARESQPIRDRCEAVIGAVERGHAVLYASGLAAIHACFVHYNPKRILVDGGYHGTHMIIRLLKEKYQTAIGKLEVDEPQPGDLLWLETPQNPYCLIYDIRELSAKAHAAQAIVVVDATFAPPPVQYCLELGADMVMHSTTKYFGGHSDLIGGVLVTKDRARQQKLIQERTVLGCIPGSLETWLLLRSMRYMDCRTFPLRVMKQNQTAATLAQWLDSGKAPYVTKVWHPSLPTHPRHDVAKRQMNGLYGGVLSVELDNEHRAVALPSRLKLLFDATSLGGVESLIEWRHRYDANISKCLLRVSVGLEDAQDLIADFKAALESLADVSAAPSKL